MKRGGPIKRHTRLKARRTRRRRSERRHDTAYMLLVKQLPCLLRGPDCSGAVEAHHAGKRAGGRKADDDTCIPLCNGHHTGKHGWHTSNGFARGWGQALRRAWSDERIADTRAKLLRDATDFISELTW